MALPHNQTICTQFNNSRPKTIDDPGNFVNTKYINEIKSLNITNKSKSYLMLCINACYLHKSFYDLKNLLEFPVKQVGNIIVIETGITTNVSRLCKTNSQNWCLVHSNRTVSWKALLYIADYLSLNVSISCKHILKSLNHSFLSLKHTYRNSRRPFLL